MAKPASQLDTYKDIFMSQTMQKLLEIFRALADPSRVRIMLLVRRMELSVGELAAVLGQSQPRVSRHIRILSDGGLVKRIKEGAWVFVRHGEAQYCEPLLAVLDALAPDAGAADLARLDVIRAERAAAADSWFAAHADDWDRERSASIGALAIETMIVAALADADLGNLIDVGTGTGRMIELLGRRARSALGIDRSPEMLRLARGRIEAFGFDHAEVRQADMYALPRPPASADTVVLHQVLHFADDPAAVIAECARVLAPGGRLLVVDFMRHGREDLRERHRHLRLGFGDEQVLGWMQAAGLSAEMAGQLSAPEALGISLWLGQRPAPQQLKRAAA